MERITLMCLLLTVVVSSSLRQHHFVNQKMNWTEAQRYCREKHTDLVTINDAQEQNEIEVVIQREVRESECVWIGLMNTKVGVWSDPDFRGAQYRNWAPSQPSGDGDCVYMHFENAQNEQKGKWHDVDCSTTRHFICFNDKLSFNEGFVPVQEEKNWSDAQKHCRQYHTDLVSVRNDSENDQIIKKLPSPDQAWIGLHRLWVWSDNSISTFSHWKPNNHNNLENCALIGRNDKGRWTDERCSNQHPFVCYDDKLVLIRENKTWTEALRYCRDRNMDLVSVESEKIQQRVMNVTSRASSNHVWLGLRHSRVLRVWFWVKGQTICYDQWAPDYDNGLDDCETTVRSGAIRTNDSHWISRPETEENNFICSK